MLEGRSRYGARMPKEKSYRVQQTDELLPFLLSLPLQLSRKDAKNLLRFKAVVVPGITHPRHDTRLKAGTEVLISLGKHTPTGTTLPGGLKIIYEDDAIVVIDKPAGLLSVESDSETIRTAFFKILQHLQARSVDGRGEIAVVHRLDRETSGLLIFAKSREIGGALQERWKSVTKKYFAVVEGVPSPATGTLRDYLSETNSLLVHPSDPKRADAKEAITHYRVVKASRTTALVELTLETGRKNQLRVQLAHAGHPIVGDSKYGAKTNPARRLALHAGELSFHHPVTEKPLHFKSPLPAKLRALLSPEPEDAGQSDAPESPLGRNLPVDAPKRGAKVALANRKPQKTNQ